MIQEGLDSMDPSKNADTIEGKTVEDWLEQGIKFLNLSQLNEALQAFNMALQLDPQNSQVWANKAIVLCLLGKLDEHINALNKVSQEDAAYVISEIRRTGRWFLSPIYSKETKLGSQEYDVWRKKGDAIFNKYDVSLISLLLTRIDKSNLILPLSNCFNWIFSISCWFIRGFFYCYSA